MEEGYQGEAWILAGDREIPVRVHLSGRFEPIDGRYRWGGRVEADEAVTALFASGTRRVRLRTRHGDASEGTLQERTPWGGCRVAGAGAPPFPLPDLAEDGRPDAERVVTEHAAAEHSDERRDAPPAPPLPPPTG